MRGGGLLFIRFRKTGEKLFFHAVNSTIGFEFLSGFYPPVAHLFASEADSSGEFRFCRKYFGREPEVALHLRQGYDRPRQLGG